MIKNFIKVAIRNLIRYKTFSLINILGLAISTGISILLILYAFNVLTFDAHHKDGDNIYFVYRTRPTDTGNVPIRDTWYPMLPALIADYPSIQHGVRAMPGPRTEWIKIEDKQFEEEIMYLDSSFFNVFTIPLLHGIPEKVLASPGSIVISNEIAKKYFGNENPVGKILTIGFSRTYMISGVMDEMPANSSFRYDIIAPLSSLEGIDESGWRGSFLFTFVKVAPGTDINILEKQFPKFVDQYFLPNERGDLKLLPLKDFDNDINNRRTNAYILLAIAFGILFIAAINFTNLSVAKSITRASEIGVRKVVGSSRRQLILQFISESMLISAIALLFGVLIAILALPGFNQFVNLNLTFNLLEWQNISLLILLLISIGLISGFYPALIMSGMKPVSVLKGKIDFSSKGHSLRNSLVIIQFSLAIILLIGIGIMWKQLHYMKSYDLHFDKENIVIIPVSARDFENREEGIQKITSFKNELLNLHGISSAALSGGVPGRYGGSFILLWGEGQHDRQPLDWQYTRVDDTYFPMYNIQFTEGRNFSQEMGTDPANAVIINETAKKILGWDVAVGKKIMLGPENAFTIIGVINDFHYSSLQQKVAPVVHLFGGKESGAYRYISVKINQKNAQAVLTAMKTKWQSFLPNREFAPFFINEDFNRLYESEENLMRLVLYSAGLAIFIACLGLFGLTAMMIVQRTKEIGIRKVLGASEHHIVGIIAKDFILLVIVSVCIASPIAWYSMQMWLENFAYRVDIGWKVFVVAAFIAILIAFLTISVQTIKAALANPVKNLRTE